MTVAAKDVPFPTIKPPRPDWLDSFTPDQQHTYELEVQRGLHWIPCPDCKRKGKRLFRCINHRSWYR